MSVYSSLHRGDFMSMNTENKTITNMNQSYNTPQFTKLSETDFSTIDNCNLVCKRVKETIEQFRTLPSIPFHIDKEPLNRIDQAFRSNDKLESLAQNELGLLDVILNSSGRAVVPAYNTLLEAELPAKLKQQYDAHRDLFRSCEWRYGRELHHFSYAQFVTMLQLRPPAYLQILKDDLQAYAEWCESAGIEGTIAQNLERLSQDKASEEYVLYETNFFKCEQEMYDHLVYIFQSANVHITAYQPRLIFYGLCWCGVPATVAVEASEEHLDPATKSLVINDQTYQLSDLLWELIETRKALPYIQRSSTQQVQHFDVQKCDFLVRRASSSDTSANSFTTASRIAITNAREFLPIANPASIKHFQPTTLANNGLLVSMKQRELAGEKITAKSFPFPRSKSFVFAAMYKKWKEVHEIG